MRRLLGLLLLIGCSPEAERVSDQDAGRHDVGITRDSAASSKDSSDDSTTSPIDSSAADVASIDTGSAPADSVAPADCGARPTPSGDDTNCAPYGPQPFYCPPGCGLGPYWYACGASVPGVAGCIAVGTLGSGYSFCCPTNDCVRAPSHDASCTAAGRPKFYWCGVDAGTTPPSGCDVPSSVGGTCCP